MQVSDKRSSFSQKVRIKQNVFRTMGAGMIYYQVLNFF